MEERISFCLTVSIVRDFFEELSGQGLRGMRKVVPLHSQSREGYAPEVLRQRSGRAGRRKRIFRIACRNENLSYLCTHITARGAGDAETEIIDIKIRQGHRPS